MSNFHIRKVAVLGAGVMGAQIAAHLTNANVKAILFDLPAKEGPKNGIVLKAIDGMAKLQPAPFASQARATQITPANYDDNLEWLKDCDLIIEAISERMDWKKSLYEKVAPFMRADAIFASNTSGLSITELSKVFPEALRHRFCGVHFFNPPRYMKLVELIPTPDTDAAILDQLETFLVTTVGKGVIRANDTPNFVANRIGVFSIAATMHHTMQFKLGFDEVDALTGPAIGRAKSATYRTADVVGLDTLAHTFKTMDDNLPNDPWHKYYAVPAFLKALIDKGALGQKTKAGFFTKKGKDILVVDIDKQDYRASDAKVADEVAAILKIRNPAEQFAALRASAHPQAQFLWAIFRDVFHYIAVHLGDVASSARDIDFAIRWGFGWKMGPFETWQAAGWEQVAKWIAEDIAAGKTMSGAPLPAWVTDGRKGVHSNEGSLSGKTGKMIARSTLPVYQRQLYPELLLGEKAEKGTTIFETDAVRMWTTKGHDDIAIVSFKTKMHSIGSDVLEGLNKAIDEAETNYKALVIWQTEPPYAAGANLVKALEALKLGQFDEFEAMVARFQATSQRIKYSMIPVVSAVDGMALGGGCEFQMHSDRVVATLESYIGLVEVGVGLVPAGGGLAYIARRGAEMAAAGNSVTPANADIMKFVTDGFTNAAMAKVGTSAIESRKLGYLLWSDVIVPHKDELLFVAIAQAQAMADSGYRAPAKAMFPVAGRSAIATIKGQLANMRDGGFISAHDFHISTLIAEAVCGGDVDAGSLVNEDYIMALERKAFCSLLEHPKSQERIMGMLSTGKPVRN